MLTGTVPRDLLILEKLPNVVGEPQIHVKPHPLVEPPAKLIAKVKDRVEEQTTLG